MLLSTGGSYRMLEVAIGQFCFLLERLQDNQLRLRHGFGLRILRFICKVESEYSLLHDFFNQWLDAQYPASAYSLLPMCKSHARNAINWNYVNRSDLQAQQRRTSVVPPLGHAYSHQQCHRIDQ